MIIEGRVWLWLRSSCIFLHICFVENHYFSTHPWRYWQLTYVEARWFVWKIWYFDPIGHGQNVSYTNILFWISDKNPGWKYVDYIQTYCRWFHWCKLLNDWVFFFQNVILFSNDVCKKCDTFVWNWTNTMNIQSALWILMLKHQGISSYSAE